MTKKLKNVRRMEKGITKTRKGFDKTLRKVEKKGELKRVRSVFRLEEAIPKPKERIVT